MSNYTHQTAPTQFVEANGIRFAYRRFGKTGGVPIVFNQHYIGAMDLGSVFESMRLLLVRSIPACLPGLLAVTKGRLA